MKGSLAIKGARFDSRGGDLLLNVIGASGGDKGGVHRGYNNNNNEGGMIDGNFTIRSSSPSPSVASLISSNNHQSDVNMNSHSGNGINLQQQSNANGNGNKVSQIGNKMFERVQGQSIVGHGQSYQHSKK